MVIGPVINGSPGILPIAAKLELVVGQSADKVTGTKNDGGSAGCWV